LKTRRIRRKSSNLRKAGWERTAAQKKGGADDHFFEEWKRLNFGREKKTNKKLGFGG